MQQPYGSEGSDGVASPDDRDETTDQDLLASTNGKKFNYVRHTLYSLIDLENENRNFSFEKCVL
jgi:hypothetical protein